MKVLADRAVFRLGFIHVLATNITELIRAFITQTYNGYLYHNTTAISDPSYSKYLCTTLNQTHHTVSTGV